MSLSRLAPVHLLNNAIGQILDTHAEKHKSDVIQVLVLATGPDYVISNLTAAILNVYKNNTMLQLKVFPISLFKMVCESGIPKTAYFSGVLYHHHQGAWSYNKQVELYASIAPVFVPKSKPVDNKNDVSMVVTNEIQTAAINKYRVDFTQCLSATPMRIPSDMFAPPYPFSHDGTGPLSRYTTNRVYSLAKLDEEYAQACARADRYSSTNDDDGGCINDATVQMGKDVDETGLDKDEINTVMTH